MISFAIPQGLLGFVRLVTTTVAAAGWVGSPMSWSPDARWLSYTVAPQPGSAERESGWLFDASRPLSGNREATREVEAPSGPLSPRPLAGSGSYRIWASQRDGEASVLIEESTWPLTAPTWSPRGRAMAFGRFVPESMEPPQPTPRGRLEVVIQDGLDRKHTVLAVPAYELDDDARVQFARVGPVWSPDGQYLAFPRPGRVPSVLIIRVDSRKLLRTLDNALLPAWSPDGTKLAFLRQEDVNDYSLQVMERNGQTFIRARTILHVGRIAAPMAWGDEGRSIFALIERSAHRFPDLDLASVTPENGEARRVFSLAPEVLRRGATIRGVAIDFDREEDLCFFSIDFEGRDSDVCWSVPREGLPYKRFHPLDQGLRVGSLAVAPNGRAVAMRFGTPAALSLPAVFDLATEHTTLIVPDETARCAWLDLLVRTSRSLLAIALPPAMVDGKPAERPTLLPLPDEIPPGHPLQPRLAKLGRLGSAMCATRPAPGSPEPPSDRETATDSEDRLFFDYLRGEFTAAAADLDALEPRLNTRERRLALLSLRAQILWAQGETDSAREVAGYLLEAVGGEVHRLEETPIGRSLVPVPGSGRPWARYLAARANQPQAPAAPQPEPPPGERDDPMFINPFAPPEPPGIEFRRQRAPAGAMPFAPRPRGR